MVFRGSLRNLREHRGCFWKHWAALTCDPDFTRAGICTDFDGFTGTLGATENIREHSHEVKRSFWQIVEP